MKIEKASLADMPEIEHLVSKNLGVKVRISKKMVGVLGSAQGIALKIVKHRRIIACLFMQFTGNSAEIQGLLVDCAHRGKGYGRALMNRAVRIAKRSKVDKLSLYVESANIPALCLYLSLGFSVAERCIHNTLFAKKVPVLLMELPLHNHQLSPTS
jgi:ribosomal protein S18 acetylase RimI-like enzyme